MPWVETESLSFIARHEDGDEIFAEQVLDKLEDLRLSLEDRFETAPGGITVVIHPSAGWLSAAHPFLPAVQLAASPASRRYLAGWAMSVELHVLNPEAISRRAAGEDSEAALRGTAERLYAQMTLAANNPELPPPWGPRRFSRYLRWAWLIEGASQYFAGQTRLFRPAAMRRLREGRKPHFPPNVRDALTLGGTVFEVVEEVAGSDACEVLVSRLRKDGAEKALEIVSGLDSDEFERVWRRHLSEGVRRNPEPGEQRIPGRDLDPPDYIDPQLPSA